MAAPRDYWGTGWYVDPEAGTLYQMVDGMVTDTTASLEDMSNGIYAAEPFAFRERASGRYAWSMANDYPTFVHVSPTGVLTWGRDVTEEEVNSQTYMTGRYGVGFSGDYMLPNGELKHIEGTSWATALGGRLIVKSDTAPGTANRYAYVGERKIGNVMVYSELPAGWEYATPTETLRRSAIGEIIKEFRDLIDDMIALHVPGKDGKAVTSVSEAAALIADQLELAPNLTAVRAV